MKFKKLIITLCLVMVFAALVTGCRPQERPVPQQQQQQQVPPEQEIPQRPVPQEPVRDQQPGQPGQPVQPQPQERPVPGAGG